MNDRTMIAVLGMAGCNDTPMTERQASNHIYWQQQVIALQQEQIMLQNKMLVTSEFYCKDTNQ